MTWDFFVPHTLTNHWLQQAEHVESPNCDQRPDGVSLDLIVIHNISLPPKEYGNNNIRRFFCNELDCDSHPYFSQLRDMRVSSHLLIQRNGAAIQFVPFDRRAWHAGVSDYYGREACNDFSIGIELEGCDDEPYEDIQYDNLIAIIQCLLQNYSSLSPEAIVGHSDIAPGRKTDPGPAFDWPRLRKSLAGRISR